MDAIIGRLDELTGRHARTFVVRLDVTFPATYRSTGTSWQMSRLIRSLGKFYTYHMDIHYVVAREQNESQNPHYHLAMMFDGSKIRSGWNVFEKAETIWQRIIGEAVRGCVHLCDSRMDRGDGIMIQGPLKKSIGLTLDAEEVEFQQKRNAALLWLMYLAKSYSKENSPLRAKNFFSSQLKANQPIGPSVWPTWI